MKHKWKASLFKKFVFSYIFVLAIPTAIMGVVLYKLSVVNLQHEVEASGISKLKQVNATMNMRMKEQQQLAARISLDARLAYYRVLEDGYKTSDVVTELERYRLNSVFINEILLYYRGDQRIYSSSGMHSIDTLTKLVYKYDTWTSEHFIEDINSINSVVVRPAEKVSINGIDEDYFLTYMYPIPPNNSYANGMLLFLIRQQTMADLIQDVLGDIKGSAYILDHTGQILVTKQTGTPVNSEELGALLHQYTETGIYNIRVGDTEYSLLNVKSEETEWRAVSLISSSQFMGKVRSMRNFVLVLTGLIVLLGIVLTVVLSARNYRPIENLAKLVAGKWPQNQRSGKGDDLELIRHTLEKAYDRGIELENQVDIQKALAREQFLLRLLKGQIENAEEYRRLAENAQVVLKSRLYTVAVAGYTTVHAREAGQLAAWLQEQCPKVAEVHVCSPGFAAGNPARHGIAYIIGLDGEKAGDGLEQLAAFFDISGENSDGNKICAGIGKLYDQPVQIKYAYIEALSAFEIACGSDSGKQVMLYEELPADQELLYPAKEQLRLLQSLKQGSATVARDALACILKEISSGAAPKYMVKCIAYDIVNTIIKLMNELCPELLKENVQKLAEFQSLAELEEELDNWIDRICEYINSHKDNKHSTLKAGLLNHINANYSSYEISLESVAEAFGISPYYLSRFFKEQTGEGFKDYIMRLRMSAMKTLLVTTQRPIKELIEELGYKDASTFTNKFKAAEGVTPGEYRRLYAKGQSYAEE
ncbi:MAG: AraC family transcriptional regulator [Paenibacillaceae bacterium]|nr:AraC family transcriptional regulator [Paenibacillaceae bacterium]